MSITVQLPDDVADWLQQTASQTGLAPEEIIRNQLAASMTEKAPRFMRLAGVIQGLPSDLSRRKGFDRG